MSFFAARGRGFPLCADGASNDLPLLHRQRSFLFGQARAQAHGLVFKVLWNNMINCIQHHVEQYLAWVCWHSGPSKQKLSTLYIIKKLVIVSHSMTYCSDTAQERNWPIIRRKFCGLNLWHVAVSRLAEIRAKPRNFSQAHRKKSIKSLDPWSGSCLVCL